MATVNMVLTFMVRISNEFLIAMSAETFSSQHLHMGNGLEQGGVLS